VCGFVVKLVSTVNKTLTDSVVHLQLQSFLFVFVAAIAGEMALRHIKSFDTLNRCNQFNFNRVLPVPASRTSSSCSRSFSAFAKFTVPVRVPGHGSTAKRLLHLFAGVRPRGHSHEQCASGPVYSVSRTLRTSSCLYLTASWVNNSRFLQSGHSAITLQSTLGNCSSTLTRVHNVRTVTLSQSVNSKNRRKWSMSIAVHQLVSFQFCLSYLFFWPRYSIPGEWKNYVMQYKKVQKSSWNEPYSSSSFTKQSCSKMALYRWIRTESRWNKKLIYVSSPDWSASLQPSLDRKTRPEALIGPSDSTATGWKMWWAWMFEYFAVLRVAASSVLFIVCCILYFCI